MAVGPLVQAAGVEAKRGVGAAEGVTTMPLVAEVVRARGVAAAEGVMAVAAVVRGLTGATAGVAAMGRQAGEAAAHSSLRDRTLVAFSVHRRLFFSFARLVADQAIFALARSWTFSRATTFQTIDLGYAPNF